MKGEDRRFLAHIQDGIPLTEAPFEDIGASVGMSGMEVISRILELIDEGVIRRFGARFDHRKLGIVANAMVCWEVPEDHIEEAGRTVSAYPGVTHCYEREVVPGTWEYNLFCVIHGHSADEVRMAVRNIEREAGITGGAILFSTRKFKHTPAVFISGNDP